MISEAGFQASGLGKKAREFSMVHRYDHRLATSRGKEEYLPS
jgi:hypothetical protein